MDRRDVCGGGCKENAKMENNLFLNKSSSPYGACKIDRGKGKNEFLKNT